MVSAASSKLRRVQGRDLQLFQSTAALQWTDWRLTLGEFEGLAVTSLEGAANVLVERSLSHGAEVVVGHDVLLDSLATRAQSAYVNKLNVDDEEMSTDLLPLRSLSCSHRLP